MFIYGNRKACIATHSDYSQACPNCKSFTIQYKIYKEYVHFFWIPVFSSGHKTCVMSCTTCGLTNEYSSKSDYYISITKTPVYLYTLLILIIGFVIFCIGQNLNYQKEKKILVDSPKINDVYLINKIRNDTSCYSFLKVHHIKNDTLIVYRNRYIYYRFVTTFDDADSFVREEFALTKKDLKELLEKGEIITVERNYTKESNFNHESE